MKTSRSYLSEPLSNPYTPSAPVVATMTQESDLVYELRRLRWVISVLGAFFVCVTLYVLFRVTLAEYQFSQAMEEVAKITRTLTK